MDRVDFYLVAQNLDAQQFACRLVNKAFKAGLSIRIELDTHPQAQQLDKLLWEFQPDCFIPHDLILENKGAQGLEPVSYIRVAGLQNLTAEPDMLLNLASVAPEHGEKYQRIAEIVCDNPDDKQRMRERFRYYRNLGCVLDYHPVS